MKATEILQKEAETEIEKEKEQTVREVIKEHLLKIEKAEKDIEEAGERYLEAKKRYDDILNDHNLLMKLCLQKVSTQPIKSKD